MKYASKRMALCAMVSVSVVSACASAPPPKDRMAWAVSSVREAQEAGAESVPAAQKQLDRAKGEILMAKSLSKENDNDRAESMLRRAAADAQLATALAREARAESEPVPTE